MNTLTVSAANRLARSVIESSIEVLCISGEISNITYHSSGHLYFTLKDDLSSLKCVVFSYSTKNVTNDLKQGEKIKIFGRLTIYEATGQYQLVGSLIERANIEGILYKKFLELKDKLTKKLYFEQARKKKIPICFKLGVVTSEQGAVIKDIVNTAKSRFPGINILFYPAQVQGQDADKQIIKGIQFLDEQDVDVIIIGRGGGSFEDLNAFNSEELADVIFRTKKPIISAVGHETDIVISDLVADLRASTPTHAAMLAVPMQSELIDKIRALKATLIRDISRYLEYLTNLIRFKKESYILRNFEDFIDNKSLELESLKSEVTDTMFELLDRAKLKLMPKFEILKHLNPLNILSKGYSIVKINEKNVLSVKDVKKGDVISNILVDGSISSEVI